MILFSQSASRKDTTLGNAQSEENISLPRCSDIFGLILPTMASTKQRFQYSEEFILPKRFINISSKGGFAEIKSNQSYLSTPSRKDTLAYHTMV